MIGTSLQVIVCPYLYDKLYSKRITVFKILYMRRPYNAKTALFIRRERDLKYYLMVKSSINLGKNSTQTWNSKSA